MKMREGKGERRTGLAGWWFVVVPCCINTEQQLWKGGGGGKVDLPAFPVYQGTSGGVVLFFSSLLPVHTFVLIVSLKTLVK
jgi:hypothetical protein